MTLTFLMCNVLTHSCCSSRRGISIAYKMEQGGVIHGVYADRLLAALSHLTGQTYTYDNVGGIYLHQEYHDGPFVSHQSIED